jgi:hypothetical protein
VAAAASVPHSLTSMNAFWMTLSTDKFSLDANSIIPLKFAQRLSNIIFKPIYNNLRNKVVTSLSVSPPEVFYSNPCPPPI